MKKLIKHRFFFLFLAVGLFLLACVCDFLVNLTLDSSRFAEKVERALHRAEGEIDGLFNDKAFVEDAINGKMPVETIAMLSKKAYSVCIYSGDSLLFWSNNRVLPFLSELRVIEGRLSQLTHLKNGRYEIIKEPYYSFSEEKNYLLVGLIPLFYDYPLENEYLENRFALDRSVPPYVEITERENDLAIHTRLEKPLFYLNVTKNIKPVPVRRALLTIFMLAFFCLGVFLNSEALRLGERKGFWYGMLGLAAMVFLIRAASMFFDWLGQYQDLDLFKPDYYSASDWLGSIGDLLIHIVLALWLAIYFFRKYKPLYLAKYPRWRKFLLTGLIYGIIVSSVFGISSIFNTLAVNSEIAFEFNNIFSLDVLSFSGLFSLSLLILCLFIFCHKLSLIVFVFRLERLEKMTFLAVVVLVFTLLNFGNILSVPTMMLLLFSICLIVLFDLFVRSKSIGFSWLLTWLIIFSGFSTILLYNYNNEKEISTRRRYAILQAQEQDRITEYLFESIQEKLKTDGFIRDFFTNAFISRKEVQDRIEKRYIGGYLFNKYEIETHVLNKNGIALRGDTADYSVFEPIIENAQKSGVDNLYYWNEDKEDAFYIGNIPIEKNGEALGSILFTLTPKELKISNVYPELLLDKRLKLSQKYERYNYAIYRNGQRLVERGTNYPIRLQEKFDIGQEFSYKKDKLWSHIYYNNGKGKVVVISKLNEDIVKPVSLFSYMFCLQLLVLILLVVVNFIVKIFPAGQFKMILNMKPSLRNRINLSVVTVILISFVSIGLVTVVYFSNEFDQYHDQRLGRKVRSVLATVDIEMERNQFNPYFLPDVRDLSEIHNMDINLYQLDGNLLLSSQIEIADKGLISDKINPLAYYNLKERGLEQYTQDENISGLDFLAAYMPLRTFQGETIGYLGLPYYSKATNLKQDVSEFMGALLNVYVFLLIIAGVMALVVGNSVTRPIQEIGEKLRQVKLGKKNEALHWDNEDEIGALVTEYNKMIEEMENSAELLVQSNRESAWREMAKQVAHEIKNPLTPMKLSIQYLERAASAKPEEAKELVSRVCKTLLEQIENLSTIASSFSNFAKMPKATNEEVNLNELVSSVYDLFAERENLDMTLDVPVDDLIVFADKNHLMRVFNNLIKNAIQAIPEERKGEISITLYKKKSMVVVQVKDNGMGISDDKRESVFVPNFTTKSSGTGLGLAISRNIVESAAGKIYFETEVGIGTEFYVELPVV